MYKKYKRYIERMEAFNAWEAEYELGLSREECGRRFMILFDLKYMLPPEIVAAAQEEHLQGLIEMQRALRKLKA
jgi:hypothetical protein